MTAFTTATTTRGTQPLPQVVASGPRTADVLRFHQPTSVPAADPRPRTAGSAALAPVPVQQPPRLLHAVPTPQEAEEVRKRAAAIARAAMEVLAGTRPLAQLTPWVHRDILPVVQLRTDLCRAARTGERKLAPVHRAAGIKAAHVSLVQPGVYEAAIVVSDAARHRAVALRLEAVGRGGWTVTALEIG
ncbi:hypothetical protein GCM10027449_25960 [Sinomonas notoginsengisoli]|uniref:Rv3235 family protein n=1 Tax=Sinomonas notoginsengisoli TaxID=1457311 RepID=UPI001F1B18F5|nr:Rv3235 family protein [Sinomonas notoginsengisoli]